MAVTLLVLGVFAMAFGEVSVYPMEFLLGILVMRMLVGGRDRGPLVFWLLVGLAGLLVFGGSIRCHVAAAVSFVILRWHGLRLGRWAYMCGAVSYSLYLTHVLIGGRTVNLLKRIGDGPVFDVLVMIVAAAISIAFAAGFAYVVERPSINLSRRFCAPLSSA